MNILCLSASNSQKALTDSVSFKVCQLIKKLMPRQFPNESLTIETISLQQYALQVCKLCGECATSGICPSDSEFQRLNKQLTEADQIFIVVPHYSPLPSKLMILFEKLNEISYGMWLTSPEQTAPLHGKTFSVIGHGGMTETNDVLAYYSNTLVKPVSSTLKSLGLQPLKDDEGKERHAVFGLLNDEALQMNSDAIFPDICLDEARIEQRLYESLFQ